VVVIELPPLRQRREDIPLLAEHLVGRLARKYQWPHLTLAPESLALLVSHDWPGNVRELGNVLARASILARGRTLVPAHLQMTAKAVEPEGRTTPLPSGSLCLKEILAETERRVIRQALEQEKWNRTQAARVLGISRRQLFDKIRQYGLEP
jgi:two-component system response regulator AtoC